MKTTLLLSLFVWAAFTIPANADSTPEPQHKDIVDVAVEAGSFTTLVAAVKAAGLVETLKGDGPFTVFAPTDEAFAALGNTALESLLKPENRDRLTAILTYHVIPGKVKANDLLNVKRAKTVNGQSVPLGLSIEGANIIQTDVRASNGIIHVIDAVLIPEQLPMASAKAANLLQTAIERGVPLYNRGQHEACASIYEVATRAVLEFDETLPTTASRPLKHALRKIRNTHDQDERAWILRDGMDDALEALSSRRMMTASSSRGH